MLTRHRSEPFRESVIFFAQVGEPTLCLHLECSDETTLVRMNKRKAESATVREDDNEETFKKARFYAAWCCKD